MGFMSFQLLRENTKRESAYREGRMSLAHIYRDFVLRLLSLVALAMLLHGS